MTDAERIEFVEANHLDVWYHPTLELPGWVADLGDPDASLWSDDYGADGGSVLCTGQATWRDAVDVAIAMLSLLRGE